MSVQRIQVEELLEQTDWLRGLARGLVQGDEAEDVAQDTMMSALQSPPPSDKPLRPWLARVATNVVRMNYRSNSRRKRRESVFSDESGQNPNEDVLHRFELHNTVATLLVDLPEPFRSTLLCRYFDDQNSTEIAASLGIAAGTVRWQLKRGLEMLRERLDEREQGGNRKNWILAFLPMMELPTSAGSGSSLATVITKGLITMKIAKVVAVTVAVVGLFYGAYILTRPEPKAVEATAKGIDTPKVEPRSAKAVRPKQKTKAPTIQPKREKLLAAMAVARDKRLVRAETSSASPARRSEPSNPPALSVGTLDKEYIRDQMREISPLIRGCYERMLSRRPDVEGKVVVEFSIVGEEEVGGLVELSEFDPEESTIEDEQFLECMQETMYALEFDPPEGGGRVVVRYPFEFSQAGTADE